MHIDSDENKTLDYGTFIFQIGTIFKQNSMADT